jgi:hypothetical protein
MNDLIQKTISSIKIESDEDRIVSGYFTDDNVDYVGHIISKDATEKALVDYEKWGNIRDMHDNPVATVVEIGKQAWNHLSVKVLDDDVWKRIKAGIYKGFSVGINPTEYKFVPFEYVKQTRPESFLGLPESLIKVFEEMEELLYITEYLLVEISLVDRPANPRALITEYKNLGSKNDLVNPKITEYYKEKDMSENKEILEKEIEAENTVENEQEGVVEAEVDAEIEKDVEVEATDEYDSELELIGAVEKLIESFDVYTASVDERVGAIEKRMDEFFASLQEQEEVEDVQEPKEEEKGLEGEDKFDAILKRLDEVAKSLVSAPEDRMGVNSGDEPAKEDKKLDRVSYKDIASYIAGKKPE